LPYKQHSPKETSTATATQLSCCHAPEQTLVADQPPKKPKHDLRADGLQHTQQATQALTHARCLAAMKSWMIPSTGHHCRLRGYGKCPRQDPNKTLSEAVGGVDPVRIGGLTGCCMGVHVTRTLYPNETSRFQSCTAAMRAGTSAVLGPEEPLAPPAARLGWSTRVPEGCQTRSSSSSSSSSRAVTTS
jgi:hypothetical protein